MMDIDRLKATRPTVLESMWDSPGTKDDLARHRVDDSLPDEEPGSSFCDDEGFVVRVDVETRSFTWHVIPISQDGDRSVE